MKDYRITIKFRNNRLLKAIEAAGGTPGQKWCDVNGLSYNKLNSLINMTASPITAKGTLRTEAARLCDVLGKTADDLWSNNQLRPLERNFSEMKMDHAQVVAMLPSEQQFYLPDFSGLEQEQTRNLVASALSLLTEREQKVLKMRFEDDMAYDEVGKRFDLTRERIRQIEAGALTKLRHPKKVGIFADALDDPDARAKYKALADEEKAMLYVIAGTFRQAADLAMSHEIPSNRLVFVDRPHRLRGIDGEGKTVFVYGTAPNRKDFNDCIHMATERRFRIEYV